ncbi:hypothetical protein ACU4GD_17235 [Cupriavidus basilensis]
MEAPSVNKRWLDRLLDLFAVLGALCILGVCIIMILMSFSRETTIIFKGGDDIVAWLCAASAFLVLGQTFQHGGIVRVGNAAGGRQAAHALVARAGLAAHLRGVHAYATWARCSPSPGRAGRSAMSRRARSWCRCGFRRASRCWAAPASCWRCSMNCSAWRAGKSRATSWRRKPTGRRRFRGDRLMSTVLISLIRWW